MQTTDDYVVLGTDWQTDKKIECCNTTTDNPPGCDCCYDTWVIELKNVTKDYNTVTEQATQLTNQYNFITGRRDKFKSWYDDLTKTGDLATAICNQFDVMVCQIEKICTNSSKAVDAIEILFCMLRDFYMEIDYIQTRYNQLINCIKCLNSSELTPGGTGIMKCLDMYNDKLTAVIKTRDDLIAAVMLAIESAYLLNSEICLPYGLEKIITDWKKILNCDEKCGQTPPPGQSKPCKDNSQNQGGSGGGADVCELLPVLTLPVCNDPYYIWVKQKYDADVALATQKASDLVAINKKKQALAACKDSLTAAIKEVDPKDRCK